jgi:predicted MFS family arabinose efflux permease
MEQTPSAKAALPTTLILLLGTAVGVIAANLYYAQPVVALIAKSLSLDPELAGLVVTLTQVGYGLGVLFIVPLGDLIENRKLILFMMGIAIVSILCLGISTQLIPYFAAALAVGLGVSALQIIVPYAAHLAPEQYRGRVVGSLMSGLMTGIMLSRPISSLLTDLISWHAVFFLSAGMMLILAFTLYKFLPPRQPSSSEMRYPELIASMGQLFARTPVLRRRAIYQACMFGAFSLFWTTTPLLLSGPEFHLSQTAIALFALVGVAGAVSAPFAGKLADHGFSRIGTTLAMAAGAISFAITRLFEPGSFGALAFLVLAAILLDAGVTANLVLGQRAIFSLRAKYRSRLNGLYIATIFVGGAFGSYIGAWAYARGGWPMAAMVGFMFPLVGLIYFATEWFTGFQKTKAAIRARRVST